MKKTDFFAPLTGFMLASVSGVGAQALTLDSAIQNYLERSPQVRAQSQLSELSEGDHWRRLLPREPQFQMTSSDDGSAEAFGLSLTTSFPGKAIAFGEVTRAKANADRLELQARRYEAIKLIVQTYLDCASGRALADLQSAAVEDSRTLARSLKLLYESGHSTQAEKIGAELQVRQASADLEAAESRADGLCKKWVALYGAGAADSQPGEIPDDLSAETIAALGARSADQARGVAQVQSAEATRSFRWWSQAPDVTWSIARNHYLYMPASPSGKEWSTTMGFSITLPVFLPFAESVEARRTFAQATLDKTAGELQLLNANADQEEAAKEFKRDQVRLRELRSTDLPLAEALVESTYAAYKSGKLGYAELILSRKTLTDLRTQEINLRVAALNARLRCMDACKGIN